MESRNAIVRLSHRVEHAFIFGASKWEFSTFVSIVISMAVFLESSMFLHATPSFSLSSSIAVLSLLDHG